MLVHGFDMHRVYLSTPGDLDAEKHACRAVISDTNEAEGMPDKILLVSVGLPQEGVIDQFRSVVAENIRQCAYFIQVFQDDWGPRNLSRKMFYQAYDSRADQSLPMREVVVFIKDAPRETDPEVLSFRQELADLKDVKIFRFSTLEEMKALLRPVTSEWVQQIRAASAAAASASAD